MPRGCHVCIPIFTGVAPVRLGVSQQIYPIKDCDMKSLIAATLALALRPLFTTCFGQSAIVQPYWNWGFNINLYSPIGQTFTALDSHVATIGFLQENLSSTPATSTYSLFAGEGPGTLLHSSSFVLPQGPASYFDADFSSVSFIPGHTYTVLITTPANNCSINMEQWETSVSHQPIPGTVDYPGGHAIRGGQPEPLFDLAFRVEPIPEPASAELLVAGFGLNVFYRRHVRSARGRRSN